MPDETTPQPSDSHRDPERQQERPLPAEPEPANPAAFSPRPHQSQHTPKDAKGRFLRTDGTFTPQSAKPAKRRKRKRTAVKHFRVDALLTDPEQRAEYDRLLADPNSTSKTLRDWLRARGHSICQNSVQRHRRYFQVDLKQLRECSRMADMFCQLSRKNGPNSIAEANQGKFEMELMMNLFKLKGATKRSAAHWNQMSRALSEMIATRRSVEEMRADFEAKAKAALKEVSKLDSRARGREIAARVREILGA